MQKLRNFLQLNEHIFFEIYVCFACLYMVLYVHASINGYIYSHYKSSGDLRGITFVVLVVLGEGELKSPL